MHKRINEYCFPFNNLVMVPREVIDTTVKVAIRVAVEVVFA